MRFSVTVECREYSGDTGNYVPKKLAEPVAFIDVSEDIGTYFVPRNAGDFRRVVGPSFGTFQADVIDGVLKNEDQLVLVLTNFYSQPRRRVHGYACWKLQENPPHYNAYTYYKRIVHPLEMTKAERTEEMLNMVNDGIFGQEVGAQVTNLMDTKSLALMAGIFSLCASNPVGWFVGALGIMLGVAGMAIDWQMIGPSWQVFQDRRDYSKDEDDLKDGARALARILATLIMEVVTGKVLDAAGHAIPFHKIREAFNERSTSEWEEAGRRAEDRGPVAPRPFTFKPFEDIPSFRGRRAAELQDWLEANGFRKFAELRRAGEAGPDGQPYRDHQSEVWVRYRPGGNGQLECVRIDPIAHTFVPDAPRGPVRISGPESQRVGFGNVPHYHMETIPPANLDLYLRQYEPQAVQYAETGEAIRDIQAEMQRARQWSTRVFGADEIARTPSGFAIQHIPLAGP